MGVTLRHIAAWTTIVQAVFLCAGVCHAQSGQIAYVVDGEAIDLYDFAQAESSRVVEGAHIGLPVWSPTGEWVAYEADREDGRAIYIVRPDGSDGRMVSRLDEWNRFPAWSPDGRKLAYSAGDDPRTMRIVTYHLGKDEEVEWGGDEARGLIQPIWLNTSTLGTILGAAQGTAWGEELDLERIGQDVLMRGGMIMSGQLRRSSKGITTDIALTTYQEILPPFFSMVLPSDGDYVEWNVLPSPEGRAIAFESNDGGDREIYLISFRRGAYDLTNHFAADWNPVWAPDSASLAFESFRGGRRGVYRVLVDTVRVSPLAVDADQDCWGPSWSSDGEWVAYTKGDGTSSRIEIVDKDGSQSRVISDDGQQSFASAWRPVPEE